MRGVIAPGAPIPTEGSGAYHTLTDLGYQHERHVSYGADTTAHVSMTSVRRFFALLKRWILGTHDGAVQSEHLDAYLDEFVFRFDRRASEARSTLFLRLLQQAVIADPVTYADIAENLYAKCRFFALLHPASMYSCTITITD